MSDFVFMYVIDPVYASQVLKEGLQSSDINDNVEQSVVKSPHSKRVCLIETPKAFKTTSTSTPKACSKSLNFQGVKGDLKESQRSATIKARNVPHPFMEVQFYHYSPPPLSRFEVV